MRFITWLRGRRDAELTFVKQHDDLEILSWEEFAAVPRTVSEVQFWLAHNHNEAPFGASVRINGDRGEVVGAAGIWTPHARDGDGR